MAAFPMSGGEVTDLAKVPNDPKVVARANLNTAAFAPEVGRYMDAEIVLYGAVADVITADKSAIPAGIDKTRSGITQSLSGIIETLVIPASTARGGRRV